MSRIQDNPITRKGTLLFLGVISPNVFALAKAETLSPVDSILPMLGGLIVILILIFGLAYLFKKFSNFNLTAGSIQVLETQNISQKEKIMIVQVRDQQFLLGVTGQSINQLGELKVDRSTKQVVSEGQEIPKPSSNQKNRSAFSAIMLALTKPKPTSNSNFKNTHREDRSVASRKSESSK